MTYASDEGKSENNKARTYTLASVACFVLTFIPFFMVLYSSASTPLLLATIFITGVAQIFIQAFFFLHLNYEPNKRWNIIASIFFMVVIVIVVGGSVWIMHELNYLMCSSCKA
ncbi:MAG: cytochrome o ubiquinol oxidase subunit IV [Endozoicomonas sp. (ex Botrylloides leachii)]|nr:cytochrome o ubiquinol oxidase subunit IV [Endozoicomonas sp. (ex Botrylloides leachii)]